MKKKDLKTGMIIQLRDGQIGKVLLNTIKGDIIANNEEDIRKRAYFPLHEEFGDDLTNGCKKYDIVKVWEMHESNQFGASISVKGELIFHRKKKKPILKLDGVEYSKSTLRSIIKKATD